MGGLVGMALGLGVGLVVTYGLLQPGAANAVESGGNVLVEAARRLLSPDVAGVPQRRA